MGKFVKGNKSGKGRPPKSLNKKTETWEAFADYCLNGGLERFQQELNKLSGKDFVSAFSDLLEFHKPKQSRTDVNVSGSINTPPPVINIFPFDPKD